MASMLTLNNDVTAIQSLLRNLMLQKTMEARAVERRPAREEPAPRESPPPQQQRPEQSPRQERLTVGRRIDVFG